MSTYSVALMIYGNSETERNALTEEKYKDLAAAFFANGFKVTSVVYNDALADKLSASLLEFDAVLVWVNPIEQGNDRARLDQLLIDVSAKGVFISTHPEVILKMGTKEVLYRTKEMGWSADIKLYNDPEDFRDRFYPSLQGSGVRVLKQYRGNGGNGVFKVTWDSETEVKVVHAKESEHEQRFSWETFHNEFRSFLLKDGILIDQEWNRNMVNGMVRCYVTGTKVSGFGYQEINAMYELSKDNTLLRPNPSRRYYFTEHCGLFHDLKEQMENKWMPELQAILSISDEMMPVIWDADFFINDTTGATANGKYTLCEINVSCVSPFPPSSIDHMVKTLKLKLAKKHNSTKLR